MEQVKRAALAPIEPSSQDRRVAADDEAKIQARAKKFRRKSAKSWLSRPKSAVRPNKARATASDKLIRFSIQGNGSTGRLAVWDGRLARASPVRSN